MAGKLLIIGCGDAGVRIARILAANNAADEIVLVGLSQGTGAAHAAVIDACSAPHVRFVPLDASRQTAVEALLGHERPDALAMTAALLRPFPAMPRGDALMAAFQRAGLGVHLPAQLPILLAAMRAAKEVGYAGPVASLSFPDVTNPVLDRLGLAPTVGLGNVSIQHIKVRAALKQRARAAGYPSDPGDLPLIRLVGHHKHVVPTMASKPPEAADWGPRVYLGEEGRRDDELAYEGPPVGRGHLPPGVGFNELTAAAAATVIGALLPGAAALRFSAPAPLGLPGGYPVRIEAGAVALDLPPGAALEELQAFNEARGREDGIERIEADGTVIFTDAARAALQDIDPGLAAPLRPDDAAARCQRLIELLSF